MFNAKEYWNKRYVEGGNSGDGSYNTMAEFKSEIINEFISTTKCYDMIDLGCGDGNQLEYFNRIKYVGVDVSPYILEKCKEKFASDELKSFIHYDEAKNLSRKFGVAISLDVVFHIIDDNEYAEYFDLLFKLPDRYVILYAIPPDDGTIQWGEHMKIRDNESYIKERFTDWKLIKKIDAKYPELTSCIFLIYERKK
jgi:SAM-dependent methyltransferase